MSGQKACQYEPYMIQISKKPQSATAAIQWSYITRSYYAGGNAKTFEDGLLAVVNAGGDAETIQRKKTSGVKIRISPTGS